MKPMPPLLQTYGEARLMIQAKGWPIEKAAEHLSEQSGLEGIHLSHAVISRKSSKGGDIPLEPELAAAIERMGTQRWHEKRAAIVEAGLRALHGEPPSVDVRQLARDLREHLASSELAQKLADALMAHTLLEDVAYSIADRLRGSKLVQELGQRLGRVNWKQIAIPAGVGALVACLALLLAPTLPGRALAAPSATPLMLIIPGAGPDGSTVRFDPGALLAESAMGEKPLDQPIPVKLLPGQKAPPCDTDIGEKAINAGCWAWQGDAKPPCGRIFRHGDKCYRPIAADPSKPVEPTPNRAPTP